MLFVQKLLLVRKGSPAAAPDPGLRSGHLNGVSGVSIQNLPLSRNVTRVTRAVTDVVYTTLSDQPRSKPPAARTLGVSSGLLVGINVFDTVIDSNPKQTSPSSSLVWVFLDWKCLAETYYLPSTHVVSNSTFLSIVSFPTEYRNLPNTHFYHRV